MKNNEHMTTLATVMEQAIEKARDQKRRVRRRLVDMRGDFDCTLVRGPWKPGRPGVKWHLYEAARRKHAALTHEVRALAWALKQLTEPPEGGTTQQSIMSKPNIIEVKGNLGGFRLLGKTPEGTCAQCAQAHPPEAPHNQQSMHWHYRFKEKHGRWPTWHDSMRHCRPEVKARWLRELSAHGVDPGIDPVERDAANVRTLIELGTRALSVRQPWAWLIVQGHKKFENREWGPQNPARKWLQRQFAETPEGITVLIHAAKGMTRDEYANAAAIAEDYHIALPLCTELQHGGIVGVAKLVSWHDERPDMTPFAFGSGIEIGFAESREFMPCKGALGFFKPVLESEVKS